MISDGVRFNYPAGARLFVSASGIPGLRNAARRCFLELVEEEQETAVGSNPARLFWKLGWQRRGSEPALRRVAF